MRDRCKIAQAGDMFTGASPETFITIGQKVKISASGWTEKLNFGLGGMKIVFF